MDKTTPAETQTPVRHLESVDTSDALTDPLDRSVARRDALRIRHAQSLTRLMEERADLRGVHPLADLVDDAIRWTA